MSEVIQRMRFLLGEQKQSKALLLLLGMILGALFEVLGIGLVFPFIAAIEDVENLTRLPGGDWLIAFSNAQGQDGVVILLACVLGAVFLIKNAFLAFLNWAQFRFVFGCQIALSTRLYEFYLRSPYSFHLERNSAVLLRNINSESLWIFHHVLIPLFGVFAELAVVALISVLLLVAAPKISLIAFSFLAIFGVTSLMLIRNRTSKFGSLQQDSLGKMIQVVTEGLGSISETKVYGVERYFLADYLARGRAYGDANVFLKVASALPRLIVETIGIGGILAASVVLILVGEDLKLYLPQLGLFAVAAVRLMPSMNRIIASMTSIRYFTASLNAVYEDLTSIDADTLEPEVTRWVSPESQLELKDVSFSYGGEVPVLQNISMRIEAGESIGLVGPSGAGKSTLVALLLGLLQPLSGKILVDGEVVNVPAGERLKVGYIPQTVRLLDGTVRQNVAFGQMELVDDARVWEALEAAQLESFIKQTSAGLEAEIGENGVRLSGGQRQRLGIARALYSQATLLVFDEATSALDNETEREVTNAIRQLRGSCTLVQIAHRLSTLTECDRLYVLEAGKIVAMGSYEELSADNPLFQQLMEKRF